MRGFVGRAVRRMRGWAARRPVPVLVALGLLGAAVAGAGGFYAYQTYDWVEHDNDFCLSCHLMREPYELFAESDHRGLGCKACHKPTFAARSQMALTQIIEAPDTLVTHAEVPNEKCASCHIEGDPEKWAIVASSAGHRVHLESDDPGLEGLQCVQCHSSTLHEFAATDKTCAQSGCHTEIRVRLGRMGDFTIHCAACHAFATPVADTAGVSGARVALQPTRSECLSCHVMRTLVDLPPDEPHQAVCSTCHNPHTQTEPAQAVETCATAGCHSDVQGLSPFHRGLQHPVVEDCTACHAAHEFRVEGDDCLACHQDIYDDAGGAGGRAVGGSAAGRVVAAAPESHVALGARRMDRGPAPGPRQPEGTGALGYLHRAVATPASGATVAFARSSPSRARSPATPPVPPAPRAPQEAPPTSSGEALFRHAYHRGVECTACHSSEERHGQVTLLGITDCRSCHHTGPAAADCRSCHDEPALAERGLSVTRTMNFTVGPPRRRPLPFEHRNHDGLECSACHADGLARAVDPALCDSCHQDHHTPAVECGSCHVEAPAAAHPPEVHVGCGGTGCHTSTPFEGAPQDRNACLVCHQDLGDHNPGRECIACHTLPGPSRGATP